MEHYYNYNQFCQSRFQQIGGIYLQGFSGSGLIILEPYRTNKNSPYQWSIILFRDHQSGQFSDLGGQVDPGDQYLSEVARREAQEESANYIHFKDTEVFGKQIDHQDTYVTHQNYRCYFVAIPSERLSSKTFQQNYFQLKNNRAPHQWIETDMMMRFYLHDLISTGQQQEKNLNCFDVHGNRQIIHRRAISCLREAFRTGLIHLTINNPRQVTDEFLNHGQIPKYLNGTTSVIIY